MKLSKFIEKMTRILIIYLKRKKRTRGFCSMIGHITSGCATKMNISKIINGDELIVFLKRNVRLNQLTMIRLITSVVL